MYWDNHAHLYLCHTSGSVEQPTTPALVVPTGVVCGGCVASVELPGYPLSCRLPLVDAYLLSSFCISLLLYRSLAKCDPLFRLESVCNCPDQCSRQVIFLSRGRFRQNRDRLRTSSWQSPKFFSRAAFARDTRQLWSRLVPLRWKIRLSLAHKSDLPSLVAQHIELWIAEVDRVGANLRFCQCAMNGAYCGPPYSALQLCSHTFPSYCSLFPVSRILSLKMSVFQYNLHNRARKTYLSVRHAFVKSTKSALNRCRISGPYWNMYTRRQTFRCRWDPKIGCWRFHDSRDKALWEYCGGLGRWDLGLPSGSFGFNSSPCNKVEIMQIDSFIFKRFPKHSIHRNDNDGVFGQDHFMVWGR